MTMRKEEKFREAINTIRGSVRKIITSDSWETDKFSGETAHFSVSVVLYNFRLKGHSSVIELNEYLFERCLPEEKLFKTEQCTDQQIRFISKETRTLTEHEQEGSL